MISRPYTTTDGFGALTKGMHSGLDPLLLDSNGQYAYGVNVTTRGGFAKTRPGFVDLGEICSGTFQGSAVYSLEETDHVAVAASGTIHIRNGTTGAITSIPGFLSASAAQVFFVQVFRWLVVQDGVSRPVVIEESGGVFSRVARDAVLEPASAAPRICLVPGTVGAYAHGRYHYVPAIVPAPLPELEMNEGQTEYVNADVVPVPVADTPADEYSGAKESGKACFVSSDVLDVLDPIAVFRMTEHRVLAEGGAYGLPAELGFIHGMGAMRGAATGTGVGSLYVFGSRGVSAFEVSTPRSGSKSWKDIAFSQVAFYGAGTYSPWSVANVNDDVWYVDSEKNLRSVGYDSAQLGSGGYAGAAMYNVSKSFESRRWTELTSDAYRPFISSAAVGNRIHWTLCGGQAVGSLDFAQSYTATPSDIPALHEGIWTGFDFKQVLSANGSLHAVVAQGRSLHLLRSSDAARTDPNGTPIKSFLVTKMYSGMYNEAYTLGDLKSLSHVDMLLAGIDRPTSISVYYRPIHSPKWTLLGSQEFNVPADTGAQVRAKVRFSANPSAQAGCNEATKEPLLVAHAFQFRIAWTGQLQIDRFSVKAPALDEAPRAQCQVDNSEMAAYPEEEFFDFEYEVTL